MECVIFNNMTIYQLNKLLEESVTQMVSEGTLLNEYVSNPVIALGEYLKQTDQQKAIEIADTAAAGYLFSFIKDELYDNIDVADTAKLQKVQKVLQKYEQLESYELAELIEQKNPKLFKRYVDYIWKLFDKDQLRDVYFDTGYPTWKYLTFERYVKNDWLIHFSDAAYQIWEDQSFKYGMDDYRNLGLTTYWGEGAKKFGGYNFAFEVKDFERYGRDRYSYHRGGWKYGKEAVMFRASGVKGYHNGDQEPQVIFWGETAKDIVFLQNLGDDDWGVKNSKLGRVIYKSQKLVDIVNWVMVNFKQYKKVLLPT